MTLLLLLLVLAVAQDKPAAKTDAPGELKFAWPEKITASVETERHKEQRRTGAAPKVTKVSMRYRMVVDPHAKGRLIRFDDYALRTPFGSAPAAADISQVLSVLQPSLVITHEGAFESVQDIAALRSAMSALVGGLKTEKVPAGVKELIATLTSDQFLQAVAANEWQSLAETWIGMPLTGELHQFESDDPIPLFPDITARSKGTVGMISRGPCRRGNISVTCGTFEMKSSTDPKVMEALMKRILAGAKDAQGVKYERYDLTTTVRLVTEIDTMIPHELSFVRTVDMVVSVPKEGRMEGGQLEKRTTRFTYPPAK